MLLKTPTASNLSCQGNGKAIKTFLTPVAGGYMIQIDGFPIYELGFILGPIYGVYLRIPNATREQFEPQFASAKEALESITAPESYLPPRSKAQAGVVLGIVNEALNSPDPVLSLDLRGRLSFHVLRLNETLTSELHAFDLYWIQPKLGLNTSQLLEDGTIIFPEPIRSALNERVAHEVKEAARCLEYEVFDAVGFHILRAVEVVILDYFTVPGFARRGAANWKDYAKVLRQHRVHRKIVGMIDRLSSLHRNELIHAEAVLTAAEASMLFALMQEVLPVMIADVARKKGVPIVNFPIFDDPRWQ